MCNNTKDDMYRDKPMNQICNGITLFRGTRLGPNYNEQETRIAHTTDTHIHEF